MARTTSLLACLHSVIVQVPEHQYHNISRVMQPQIRSLCDGLMAGAEQAKQEEREQMLSSRPRTVDAESEVSRTTTTGKKSG